jgi:DNA-binding GntR family transcriptional regulator
MSAKARQKSAKKAGPAAPKATRTKPVSRRAAAGHTVSQDVYQSLKKDILTCRHKPGAVLKEKELASLYGTSRVPIREACGRLQQEGLLEAVPYKGYFVSQVSLNDITDYFDLRLLLETYAVEQAVSRASDKELAELEKLAAYEYTYHDWPTYLKFLECNCQYHEAIARLSGNAKLARIVGDILERMQRFFFLGLDLGSFGPEMREEHEVLTHAIRAGSKERAIKHVQKQIERSRERILKALVTQRSSVTIG